MATPLISICLPNLNTRPFLEERMESILAQTVTDWELIICDSYSTDGSWEFFQKFRSDPRIQMFQAPRRGTPGSWNYCVDRARGQFVYVATSDDTMRPDCLERLLSPLQRFPHVRLAYCDYEKIDARGKPMEIRKDARREFLGRWMDVASVRNGKTEFLLHCALNITWVTITSVLFARSLMQETGPFPSNRGPAGDFEWALRASLATDIAYVPGKLSAWRTHEQQATPQFFDWRYLRNVLDMLQAVLNDPKARVPAEWKKVPHWQEELSTVWRMEYLDGFHLDRGYARQNPFRFLQNCGAALRHAPRHFLRQLACGFRWSPEFSPNRVAVAKRFFELFTPPWPPQRL